MSKQDLLNTFFDLQNNHQEGLKWMYNNWDDIKKTLPTKFEIFFNSFFHNFCKENSKYGENTIEILLAISVSNNLDEVDKTLKKFSENSWGEIIRNSFSKKISKFDKRISFEDICEIVRKSVILEINFIRKKRNLFEVEYFKDLFFYDKKDILEVDYVFGKKMIKNIIEELVKREMIFSKKISKIELIFLKNKSSLNIQIKYK